MGSITDVPGVKVGQAEDAIALTGVTVILLPEGGVTGVDVRGASPGTRETDLLDPANTVQKVNAIALCGGSAFGLAAANGVMRYLREQDIGFETPYGKVPIVPAAVIYDLGVGQPDVFPDDIMGYQAARLAGTTVTEGNAGAGAGASIGKVLGSSGAMKSGVGTSSATLNLAIPGLPAARLHGWSYRGYERLWRRLQRRNGPGRGASADGRFREYHPSACGKGSPNRLPPGPIRPWRLSPPMRPLTKAAAKKIASDGP